MHTARPLSCTQDVLVFVKSNTHCCRLTVSPRISLMKLLKQVSSGDDTWKDMRGLLVVHRGVCYEGKALARNLEVCTCMQALGLGRLR